MSAMMRMKFRHDQSRGVPAARKTPLMCQIRCHAVRAGLVVPFAMALGLASAAWAEPLVLSCKGTRTTERQYEGERMEKESLPYAREFRVDLTRSTVDNLPAKVSEHSITWVDHGDRFSLSRNTLRLQLVYTYHNEPWKWYRDEIDAECVKVSRKL